MLGRFSNRRSVEEVPCPLDGAPDLPTRPRAGAPHVDLIHGARILHVDDEDHLRSATRRLLRRAGAICLLAGTHDQAWCWPRATPRSHTLAILDFHMPDGPVDGLPERLRGASPGLLSVATSGAERGTAFRDWRGLLPREAVAALRPRAGRGPADDIASLVPGYRFPWSSG
jgi:CheY-like chemotaxis protein